MRKLLKVRQISAIGYIKWLERAKRYCAKVEVGHKQQRFHACCCVATKRCFSETNCAIFFA
jgi:hypothetical protein